MKPDLMEILCCPVCKGDLKLDVKSKKGDEIEVGTLTCDHCHVVYSIDDGIPDLLPPETKT